MKIQPTQKQLKLTQTASVLVAILAFIAAVSSLMLSRSLNRSVLAKNEEAIVESKITDQWTYYQTKNIRLDIMDAIHEVMNQKNHPKKTVKAKSFELSKKKREIFSSARSLEKERDQLRSKSAYYSSIAQQFSMAGGLVQLSILLLSLVLLSQSHVMFRIALYSGAFGMFLFAFGMTQFLA